MPLDQIVAQLNMDMIGRNHDNQASEANTVYPVGSDRISTELHNIMIDANAALPKPLALDYALNDPTDPERVYYRSDHYSYAARPIWRSRDGRDTVESQEAQGAQEGLRLLAISRLIASIRATSLTATRSTLC